MTAPGRTSGRARTSAPQQLRVDPVACEGVGLCAKVADALVALDRWGYPVIGTGSDPAGGLDRGELRAAARAVRACPRRALWIEEIDRI